MTDAEGQPATSAGRECEHRTIVTHVFSDPDDESYGDVALWACQDCRRRFAPAAIERQAAESALPSVERRLLDKMALYLIEAVGFDNIRPAGTGDALGEYMALPDSGTSECGFARRRLRAALAEDVR